MRYEVGFQAVTPELCGTRVFWSMVMTSLLSCLVIVVVAPRLLFPIQSRYSHPIWLEWLIQPDRNLRVIAAVTLVSEVSVVLWLVVTSSKSGLQISTPVILWVSSLLPACRSLGAAFGRTRSMATTQNKLKKRPLMAVSAIFARNLILCLLFLSPLEICGNEAVWATCFLVFPASLLLVWLMRGKLNWYFADAEARFG